MVANSRRDRPLAETPVAVQLCLTMGQCAGAAVPSVPANGNAYFILNAGCDVHSGDATLPRLSR